MPQHNQPLQTDPLDVTVNPDDIFEDPTHPLPPELITELGKTEILTERQAEAYVHREIEHVPREAVADQLDVSPSDLDSLVQTAKNNLADAKRALKLIDTYRSPDFPDECSDCGAPLGGVWVTSEDGDALCHSCSGLPQECPACGEAIRLGDDLATTSNGETVCMDCADPETDQMPWDM